MDCGRIFNKGQIKLVVFKGAVSFQSLRSSKEDCDIGVCVCVCCLVKKAGPPDGSHFIGVVEEADAGLRQPVTFSDPDVSEAAAELLPDV